MSNATTKLWLDRTMSDEWYASQMPISRNALKKAMGVGGIFNDEPTNNAWRALQSLIPKIENREVIFMPGHEVIVRLPEEKRIQRKLSAGWSLDGWCGCGSNKYLPVMIEKEYAACFICIPPSQYRAIGATPIKRSLILDAMKNYYIEE